MKDAFEWLIIGAAICAVVFVLGFSWGLGLVAAGATPGVVVNVVQDK